MGRQRFDAFFGEKERDTPITRRLIFSPFSIIMGTTPLPEIGQHPVQPLSFFARIHDVKNKANISEKATIGWQIVFLGDLNYNYIHAAGPYGSYTCVVTSVHPLKVRTFGIGKREFTEQGLCDHHIAVYSQPPSLESFSMLDPTFRTSPEFYTLTKVPTTQEKISGFQSSLFAIKEDEFQFIINGKPHEVIKALDEYVLMTAIRVKEELTTIQLSRRLKELTVKQKTPPGPKTYAGLNGLKGQFASPPNKQNNHDKIIKKTEETQKVLTQQEPFLPGFSSGFLNPNMRTKPIPKTTIHTLEVKPSGAPATKKL